MNNDNIIIGFIFEVAVEGKDTWNPWTYYDQVTGNYMGNISLQKSCHYVPLVKATASPSRLYIKKLTFTVGATTFYLRIHYDNFSADSIRAYVFWQLLCITLADSPMDQKLWSMEFWPSSTRGLWGEILVGHCEWGRHTVAVHDACPQEIVSLQISNQQMRNTHWSWHML